jgi:[CysO sulfur-carrier protein]-S-L-cysteine hydrolase
VAHGLVVPRAVAEQMMTHARTQLPNEASGLLGGSLAEGRAASYHPARDSEASPLRYAIDPEELVQIMFAIERAGEELVAIFHSHPGSSPSPSATDRRTAMYPDQFYVIASLADPDAPPDRALRAWRIIRGHSFEVPLAIG